MNYGKGFIAITLGLVALVGCTFVAPARTPIEQFQFHSPVDPKRAIVLLPGAGQWVEEYQSQGLVDAIVQCDAQTMVVGVEAYFAYYRTRSIVDRLREDVVLPLRQQGIEEVWLLGTSMGGVGTFLYRAKHPEDIDGIIAIAPFLGDREELDAYLQGDPDEADNKMAIVWDDLRDRATQSPRIVLGFGSDDSLAPGIQWLSPRLPSEDVIERAGGHDWETWSAMWPQLLERAMSCSNGS